MTTPLFLDQVHKPKFQKIAMPVRLSQSPEAWQRDIAGEIYKQLPYIGDYAVNVILDKVDAQRGFGFGSIHISNKTDAPMPDQAEMPSVRIPVIVRDYLMSPLDVFMDGEGVYPLTEGRLREKLFRPQALELSTRKPSDKGLVDQLYPPMRSNYGMGAMGGDSMGMGKAAAAFLSGLEGTTKTASDAEKARRAAIGRMHSEAASNNSNIGMKCASLVEAISMTLSEKDRDQLVSQITGDMEIKVAALANPNFQKLAMKIASTTPPGVEKTAQALVDNIKPNIVQLEKLASGDFRVKWANSQAFAPQEDVVSPKDASQMAGADISQMSPGATVTLSSEKAQKQSLDEPVYVKVQQFGKYETQNLDTNENLQGWVIPIVDFDMHPLEMYVFVDPGMEEVPQGGQDGANPSQEGIPGTPGCWSVQDEIAGRPLDTGNGFEELAWAHHDSIPQGTGFFLSIDGQCCLLPITIHNATQDPSGTAGLSGETMFGEPVQLQSVPGLKQIQEMGEGVYGIPDNLTWVPLSGDPIMLAKNPLDISAQQEAQEMPNQVQVGSTGPGEFSMEGQPLAKVATSQRRFIKKAEAEFLLVAMGVELSDARGILKKAESGREWVKCAGRAITPLATLHSSMTKKAAAELADFPYHLRQNLVKEASVIDDADTTDKVLAMNFINPENIETFAKYLPELDQASKKLAELLVGVRLGVGSVDEGAVERAMKGLERVIEGLKLLQQKVAA